MTTLDNLRKAAKRWLKALRAGDAEARARLARAYPARANPARADPARADPARADPRAADRVTLREVQHALARERGHESWSALTRALAAKAEAEPPLTTLLSAAARGDAAGVASSLDAHPHLIDERGVLPGHRGLRTALHFGSAHEAVVRTLLARGADPNIRDEGDHAFPLHFAAERGDLAVVRLLVEHGADPIGGGTGHELDVLGWAVCVDSATHLEVARFLLAHGARHTLPSAVAMGEVAAIRALAAAGADLDQRMDRTNHRRTPLHLAVAKQQGAALAALIELGADLHLADAVGLTPLDQAALYGEDEMTRLLLDAGARITLPAAIVLERDGDVERLVRDTPDLLSVTSNRVWARILVHASGRASGRALDTLLHTVMRHRAGLSIVNLEDDEETAVDGAAGFTPLHAAALHGNDEAVAVLLAHGANPRRRDGKYCATPAGWAAHGGHLGTAGLLLAADVDLFDAIDFDRADRIAEVLDRDPGALDRPFGAYASCPARDGQWWPAPACTPLEWAAHRRKENALRLLRERGAGRHAPADVEHAERALRFLKSACWDEHLHGKAEHRLHDRAAQRLLAADPTLARDSLFAAIVCGEVDEVARLLAARPESARLRGGGRGWTPILYLAYTRLTHPATHAHALAIARLLLDHGAEANDFYMAGDARYSALVGVAGEGEQDAPRQPYAAELFALLLARGAEPFDIQVLYNTHFSGDILWWLELVHQHTVDTPRGAAWRDPDWAMFDMGAYGCGARFLLETAIRTRRLDLAAWCLAHGAGPQAAPARDRRFPKRSLYELAVVEDLPALAELLAQHGAARSAPALDEHERFLAACFRLDREEARRLLVARPHELRSAAALFAAAKRDRPDVLALLLELGFSLETPDWTGKRALHEAAANNALRATEFLLEHGAEVDPRESTYGGTPISWAAHGDHAEVVSVLSRWSRAVGTLASRGYVDRLREVLAEDPSRARAVSGDGCTPLWALPDDEAQAAEVVELLLAAGADAGAKNAAGETAAERARQRGMWEVALRIDAAARRSRP